MTSKISNPYSAGGGGQFFEAKVQASFLINLLIGGQVPCLPLGKVESIRLQGKQAGFHTDDVVIKVCTEAGTEHRLLVQIKHRTAITISDEEFKDTLKSAWADFNNPISFNSNQDAIALATGPLPDQTIQHARPLLDWARTSANSKEFIGKVSTAYFSSDQKRNYLQVFRTILTESAGTELTDESLWQFLKHFYFLSYDFDVQGSKDEASILSILKLSRSQASDLDAQSIWNGLIIQAQEWNKNAGTFTNSNLGEELRLSIQPQRSTAQREAVIKLKEHCDFVLKNIQTELAPSIKFSRKHLIDALINKFESSRIVIVQGDPGSGKSAIIKMLIEALPGSITPFAFKAQEFNHPHIHQFLTSIGIHLTVTELMNEFGLLPRKILLIDSAERIFELSNHEAFRHLIDQLNKDPSWTIVITCRESSAQELKEHLLSQWGAAVSTIKVPPLNSKELEFVSIMAPQLAPLIANQRLAKLLSLPFILSLAWKAFPTSNVAETAADVDENQFKDIVWNGYIERSGQTSRALQIKRSQCLISISVQRAKKMSLFVTPENQDAEALESLINDGILIRSDLGSFAPAHDVLEDWAVFRFIAQQFELESRNPIQFIHAIGAEPAMRRNFRLWLFDALSSNKSSDIANFVSSSFRSSDLPLVWRDEIAIATLQSESSGDFLKKIDQLLLNNNNKIYKQLVHILRTACKAPNESMLKTLGFSEYRNQINVQSAFVIPTGSGWRELILFTHQHLDNFDVQDAKVVLGLLKDWSQILDVSASLPPEAVVAAQICLKYWEMLTTPDSYVGKLAEEFLELLFRFPQAASDQVENLIRFTLNNQSISRHHADTILGHVTESWKCNALCTHLPNLVIEVAEKVWHRQPKSDSPFTRRQDLEEMFGFNYSTDSDYSPESALHGPFPFLLSSHPDRAIDFIIRLANKAALSYSQSELSNEITKIQMCTKDGSRSLLGSFRLWVLYRAMMPGPNILKCALMALEAWLLAQIKHGKDIKKILCKIINDSTSVATISIITSIAVAHPEILEEEALPLLQIKEFYRWDLRRSIQERSHHFDIRPLMGIPTGGVDEIYYDERKQLAALPHRTNHLENLATRLQLTKLKKEIWNTLHNFKKNLPPENDQKEEDKLWRIALHRMDIRNFEAHPNAKSDEVIFTPGEPEPDLQEHIKKTTEDFAQTERRLKLELWGTSKFNRNSRIDNSFANWKDALTEAQALRPELLAVENDGVTLGISGPAFIAVFLLRDHRTELQAKDLDWCREVILDEVLKKDTETGRQTAHYRNSSDGSRPCAYVLPLLLQISFNKEEKKQIERCIATAITHANEEVRDYAAAGIRDWLWEHDIEFAKACLGGLLELSSAINQIYTQQIKKKNFSWEKEGKEILKSISETRVRITKRKTIKAIQSPKINLESSDWPELLDALTMIRPSTADSELKELMMLSLNALLDEVTSDETQQSRRYNNPNYKFQYAFADLFVPFALARSKEEAIHIGQLLKQRIDQCPEYLAKLFRNFPYEEDRVHSKVAFWSIWRIVSEPIFKNELLRNLSPIKGYHELQSLVRILLFADMEWKKGIKEWQPVTDNKDYFEQAIIQVGNTKAGFNAFLSLLNSVGQVFLPDLIIPLSQAINNSQGQDLLSETNSIFDLEVLMRKVCYEFGTVIKQKKELHEAVLSLLDKLVERGSHTGFRLRDYIVTPLSSS